MMRIVVTLAVVLALAGCGRFGSGDEPGLTVPNVAREQSVDPARAAQLINAYRVSKGAGPLQVDPALNRIAAETARELARRDTLKTRMHTAGGLARRLLADDYSAERAAENLGAGYPTLVMAVDGWKTSPGHNKNLLNREMTHMGIGLALTQKGKFHSYWVLLLAKPD
ncbi:CAP domain-containing protein [Acuticoccus sp. I52.16.1]|uniref:CAP domain-containing protein n=1 Tax=Acuticoccus sp. I52.16.1 TaxID=2928472 RepID=UPI001FCF968C|nr:CAP domain-containing protein [Acuticoccus sp. I52.16.1]UOM36065.1 CAP domain-containing protein [Acuticoccus sp. I52.16.1]